MGKGRIFQFQIQMAQRKAPYFEKIRNSLLYICEQYFISTLKYDMLYIKIIFVSYPVFIKHNIFSRF